MSTYYRPLEKISACCLFDGRFEKSDIREHRNDSTTETERCLTDGRNYLWVSIDDAGFVYRFRRYGENLPGKMLNAVANAFDTDIASEYEPRYWGFDTEEELIAWRMARTKEAEALEEEVNEKFYVELVKFLRGEPNGIGPGTVYMRRAKVAKTLVEKDPTLLLLENKDRLLGEMRSICDRYPAILFALTPEGDIVSAEMIAAPEDDLQSD
jgi:hypothetical protein